MSDAEDNRLVRRCIDGELGAFERLLERYEGRIFNAVLRMLHNYEDAEDTTQAIFVKVFENLRSFDSRHKFFSWLYRIAMNESLNFIARRDRLAGESKPAASGECTAGAEGHEATAARRDLYDALARIKPEYRSLIILKHILGCSYRDIGDVLRLPEKTVKSRLYTARELLRQELQDKTTQNER
jgi:RNA polymerase sigma-70 factor (ECF subfamily)